MTGTVEWGTLIWLVTVLVGAVVGAISAIVMAYRLLHARDEAIEKAFDELAAFKLHAAETYATKSGTTAAVERVEEAVGDLKKEMSSAFDRLSQRIDRVLEHQTHTTSPTPRRTRGGP